MISGCRLARLTLALVFSLTAVAFAQQPLSGKWVAAFQKIDNGEDNKMFLELHQEGDTLKGHFHTLGYGGDLSGPIENGHFTLFAPWDKVKPFCKGEVVGDALKIKLDYGEPFTLKPETPADVPPPPAYIAPPALHKVPSNGLAKTPPMGWNSWNKFGGGVNDADVREMADAIVASGMRDAGYQYVNIDDTWEGVRDANGVLQPNHRFPDMKALADYVHSKGLKLGIYSSPGLRTCGGYPGSYGHEAIDAKTWASWGIDYLKYDWCSAADIYKEADLQAIYQRMGDALAASGRPIVYSLCEYGEDRVQLWGADVGANLWRTTGDIRDEWVSMEANGFSEDDLVAYAGPGHWNDPDMLEVGNGKMTDDEYRTHMSLWSLLAAPLLAGNDLRDMSPETKAILLNRDVIAIDQDPLGKQATRLYREGDKDVWTKPLADGSIAVGVFNRGGTAMQVTLNQRDLGLGYVPTATDLWTHTPVKFTQGSYSANVPSHGVLLLRVHPAK
jgi:alpha-galactosidase